MLARSRKAAIWAFMSLQGHLRHFERPLGMSVMPPIATENGEALKRRRANGNNFSNRFPQIVAALTVLSVRSCLIDSEAVVCNESGLAVSRPTPPGRRLAAVLELRRINLLERAVRRAPSHLVNELLTKDEARRRAAIFAQLQDLLRKRG
jgi:hypothetical protein